MWRIPVVEWDVNSPFLMNLFETFVLVALVVLGRWLAIRRVRRAKPPSQSVLRQWERLTRNVFLALLFLGLIAIWAEQIQAVAISMVAVAAALVIATKELILCFMGGVLKGSTRPFEVGDRIEIGDLRGDVVDTNMFTTTLHEIGPGRRIHQYTGRIIEVPNSLFLSTPVINETSRQKYVLHTFTVPMDMEQDWRQASQRLLDSANRVSRDYLGDATKSLSSMAKKRGVDIPKAEPRVAWHFPEAGKVDLVVRMPVPSFSKGRVEQDVLRDFFGKSPK
ncbi:MAG: mechanosensitive ion channel [Pseudobdellovibrionaceae bacterium]|nr:mechanosensitive ion channel [Bdellovibrionales bacterium]USN48393.1 MAG: mechanosensitive ion channel [Pseudobdellovibrionaceae bacterium]